MPVRPPIARQVAVLVLALSLLSAAVGCSSGSTASPDDSKLLGAKPIRYGDAPSQVGELTVPRGSGPYPVVVLIHGGWWREADFDRRLMRDASDELVYRGYATWNLEYRLVGEEGGGWPGTFEDIAAGIDKLAEIGPENDLDLHRVVLLGHSAGGQLALWAAARGTLPPESVGILPKVVPASVIAIAAVTDLEEAANDDLGGSAVPDLLGGTPKQVPDRYAQTSPVDLLPIGRPTLIVHGTEDDRVPIAQGRAYYEKAKHVGETVEIIVLDGGDHFEALDTTGEGWKEIVARLPTLSAPTPQPGD